MKSPDPVVSKQISSGIHEEQTSLPELMQTISGAATSPFQSQVFGHAASHLSIAHTNSPKPVVS